MSRYVADVASARTAGVAGPGRGAELCALAEMDMRGPGRARSWGQRGSCADTRFLRSIIRRINVSRDGMLGRFAERKLGEASGLYRACLRRGAAPFRRRPNQSLRRRRGRRQLDPSTRGRGEEAAKGTGVRRYLCRQRPLGVFRWYSRPLSVLGEGADERAGGDGHAGARTREVMGSTGELCGHTFLEEHHQAHQREPRRDAGALRGTEAGGGLRLVQGLFAKRGWEWRGMGRPLIRGAFGNRGMAGVR